MEIKEAKGRLKNIAENAVEYDYLSWDEIEAIRVLLPAYEKEKEILDKINKLNIPVDTLIAEFERLEDLEDDLTTVYINGVYDGEKKVKDKIKAKIEEVEKRLKEETRTDFLIILKILENELQSLLEKE